MVERKQYAHNTKLSFCEISDTILPVYGNLIQNREFYFKYTNKSFT